jgi:FkbM family methyltransferase
VELNGYQNIVRFESALSDVDGDAQLHLGKKSGWHSLVSGLPDRLEGIIHVPVRRLDSVLEEIGLAQVDMIKIDVEGAEMKVLWGAAQTLSRNEKIILLIDIHAHLNVDPREVLSFLADLGFRSYKTEFPYDTPVDWSHCPEEILARRNFS